MMSNVQLFRAIDNLSPQMQIEVAHFVEFLASKSNTSDVAQFANRPNALPLKFGAGKGLIKYLSPDWENDLEQEFDVFNENESRL